MKKSLLLLAAAAVAASANAQERAFSNVHAPLPQSDVNYEAYKMFKQNRAHAANTGLAGKGTAAPRWYEYTDYFQKNEDATSSSVNYSLPYLWGNNNVLMTFSSGPDTANLVSYGLVGDPAFSGFNNVDYYPGLMKITSTDAYAVDSIAFTGAYLVNPARAVVDTLRVSFVYGNGATSADVYKTTANITSGSILENYGAVGGTMDMYRMHHNGARLTPTGSTMITKDIYLNNLTTPPSWAADTVNGVYVGKVGLGTAGTGISIPAGSMVGVSVSFISGDAVPAYDTVFIGSPAVPPVKYNMFRAGVVHRGSASAAAFPMYSSTDRNMGGFVDKTTTNSYVPQWYWSSGTAAASVQYPDISYRAICASCGVVGTVEVGNVAKITNAVAYPNPANDMLYVPFTLNATGDVTVTLTNMVGQVVASQTISNVANGKASFNTANLANGVYSCTIAVGNERTTGRVSIVH